MQWYWKIPAQDIVQAVTYEFPSHLWKNYKSAQSCVEVCAQHDMSVELQAIVRTLLQLLLQQTTYSKVY